MDLDQGVNLFSRLNHTLELGKEGVARTDEIEELWLKIEKYLSEELDEESIQERKFDKWINQTHWWEQAGKYAPESHVGKLKKLGTFLAEYLEENADRLSIQKSTEDEPPRQKYISEGETYDARVVIRDILEGAESLIDIQDNYLNYQVFGLLEPLMEENDELKVRLLTSKKAKRSFNSDYWPFLKQFKRIGAKINERAHGRFVILDSEKVYMLGHSIKNFGDKAHAISAIDEPQEAKKSIQDFESWWNNGKKIEAIE